jgi:hypothetical protein
MTVSVTGSALLVTGVSVTTGWPVSVTVGAMFATGEQAALVIKTKKIVNDNILMFI